MIKKYIAVIFSALLLTSCSVLSPVKTESENTYLINTVPSVPVKSYSRHATLMVMPPDTVPFYSTTQMAYTNKPYQLAYFGQNRWAETPSQMLLPLIMQTLQNTKYFHAIVTPPYVGRYDYALNTQLLMLQQDFTRTVPVMRLTLRAQLSRVASGQLLATKQFTIVVPIRQKTPYGGVIAANQATSTMLRQLAEFTLNNLSRG